MLQAGTLFLLPVGGVVVGLMSFDAFLHHATSGDSVVITKSSAQRVAHLTLVAIMSVRRTFIEAKDPLDEEAWPTQVTPADVLIVALSAIVFICCFGMRVMHVVWTRTGHGSAS